MTLHDRLVEDDELVESLCGWPGLGGPITDAIAGLQSPAGEERTWNGALGGFVPYDLRMPTLEKTKNTLWNPDGAIVTSRVFGVGWSINLGAIVAKLRSLCSTD